MKDKTENEDQCGRNGERRGTAPNNAEKKGADIERNKIKGGKRRQRKRGKTLLTSTEGHREEKKSQYPSSESRKAVFFWFDTFNLLKTC